MQHEPVSVYTASNGLRMVHLHRPGSAVGYLGANVLVGSRDESPSQYGLAHFVEHTIFKGTARRSPWHIINRMESVGGELNAYTTKEETVVYSAFPAGQMARAAELIADIVINSRFPARELDKEREVVADEINSYLDIPSEAVFDDFEEDIFANTPLAHNILGNTAALQDFTSEVCQTYLSQWYVASNMVVFYAGNQRADRVFKLLERLFAGLSQSPTPERNAKLTNYAPEAFEHTKNIGSHQAHSVIGSIIGGVNSADRHTISLLTNILGGPGMNSLLNVALREKRGLVYSVEASTGIYTDCGLLSIYYGCDPDDNALCDRLVRETIDSVANGDFNARKLSLAKKQYLGQHLIASENIENRILGIARSILLTSKVPSRQATIDKIMAVRAEDLAGAAQNLKLSSLSLI